MNKLFHIFCIIFFYFCAVSANATEIKEMRLATYTSDTVRFVAELSQKTEANIFRLENPSRLVVDFKDTTFSKEAQKKNLSGAGFIKSVRIGVQESGIARVVFDLPNTSLTMKNFFLKPTGPHGWRFVLDLSSSNAPSVVPVGKSDQKRSVGLQPFGSTTQKKQRVIVLDPGHGGQDPGAISRSGHYEKHITLNMARETRDILKKKGYKVVLTRDSDVFIPLRGRIKKAHEAHADLFISIHADSAKNSSAKGLSVYTVSEKASDAEAAALAERENKADILLDMDLSEYEAEIGNIFIDLAKKSTMDNSARYATYVVQEMKKKVQLVPNAHRMAGFVVLKSPSIPSVLVELGYLSNKTEDRLLQQKSYRRKLAESLAKAVDTYFDNLVE